MATAIKAIPTLYGEDAERFLIEAEAAEKRYREHGPIDWSRSEGVLMTRRIFDPANML